MEILGAVLDTAQRRIQLVLPQQKHLFTVPMCRLVCPMQHSRLDHPHLPGLPVIMAQGHDHCTGQDPPPTVSKTGFFRSIAWKRLRGTFSESSTSDGSRFDEARSTVLYSLPFLLCLPPCLSFRPFVRVRAPVVPAVLFNVASSLYCHDATLTFSRIMDGRVDPDTCGPAEQLRRSRNFGPGANFRNGT